MTGAAAHAVRGTRRQPVPESARPPALLTRPSRGTSEQAVESRAARRDPREIAAPRPRRSARRAAAPRSVAPTSGRVGWDTTITRGRATPARAPLDVAADSVPRGHRRRGGYRDELAGVRSIAGIEATRRKSCAPGSGSPRRQVSTMRVAVLGIGRASPQTAWHHQSVPEAPGRRGARIPASIRLAVAPDADHAAAHVGHVGAGSHECRPRRALLGWRGRLRRGRDNAGPRPSCSRARARRLPVGR
jgi:hypothetical protein